MVNFHNPWGPRGKACHHPCPEWWRRSTQENADGPRSPMPYGDGRDVTCRSMPELRYLDGNGGSVPTSQLALIADPLPDETQCVLHYGMGHGSAFQMSRAYSAMVRSLENFPELATFRMALRAHSPGFAYNAPAASCDRQYEVRSAKCM